MFEIHAKCKMRSTGAEFDHVFKDVFPLREMAVKHAEHNARYSSEGADHRSPVIIISYEIVDDGKGGYLT